MAKQTKRERKFASKGGIQARLEKGTVTRKGKLKRKRHRSSSPTTKLDSNNRKKNKLLFHDDNDDTGDQQQRQQEEEQFSDDFVVGKNNLGDLDIESFFANFAESIEKNKDDDDDEDEEEEEEEGSSSSHSEDEEDKKEEKEEEQQQQQLKGKKKNKMNQKEEKQKQQKDKNSHKKKETETSSTTTRKKNVDSNDDDDDDDDDDESNSESSSSSSNSSDDEEEDVEAAEERMKKQLKKLKSSDPDFHDFLKEHNQSLLQFGQEEEDEKEEKDSPGGKNKNDEEDDNDNDDDDDDDSDDDDDDDDDKQDSNEVDDDDDDVRMENSDGKEPKEENENDHDSSKKITLKFLTSLEKGAFTSYGLKSLKKLVKVYNTACHMADSGGDNTNDTRQYYHIDSSEVFDKLMVTCLNRCHEAFYHHLLLKEPSSSSSSSSSSSPTTTTKTGSTSSSGSSSNQPLEPHILERSHQWKHVRPILLQFIQSTLHLLSESKEPELLSFVLDAMSNYLRYLSPLPRVSERMLKLFISLWSAPLDYSEDYQVVRLNAFLRIRQLALTQPFPFIEDCLKKTYLAYCRRAKFGIGTGTGTATSSSSGGGGGGQTATTTESFILPTLTFMGNCVVELYRLDYQSSYQHAFVYIRQLALLLRTAIQKKSLAAYQDVYCWQYMQCLKLWVAVLSASCRQLDEEDEEDEEKEKEKGLDGGDDDDDDNGRIVKSSSSSQLSSSPSSTLLRSLIFPLTQVILGTIRMVPSPTRHVPWRFHCVRLLQQLAAFSELYIPTVSTLLDILDWNQLYMKPMKVKKRNKRIRGIQLSSLLKFSSKDDPLRTTEEQEACMDEFFVLLHREIDLYRYSSGFPEFSIQINQRLRKFCKETKNHRWRAFARGCIDICERYSTFAMEERSKLLEAPKDVSRLEILLPTTTTTTTNKNKGNHNNRKIMNKEWNMTERYEASIAKEKKETTTTMMMMIKKPSTTTTAIKNLSIKPNKTKEAKKEDNNNNNNQTKQQPQQQEQQDQKQTKKPTKKQKKKKKGSSPFTSAVADAHYDDDAILKEEDMLEEGVDWMDDESE